MIQPKFKMGQEVWYLDADLYGNKRPTLAGFIIQRIMKFYDREYFLYTCADLNVSIKEEFLSTSIEETINRNIIFSRHFHEKI